jgi:hypothetical protein
LITFISMFGAILTIYYFDGKYNKDIELVSNFIKEREGMESGNKARNTYIISDDYSQIGFKVWNRVKKYDWALNNFSQNDLNELLSDQKYRYFIVHKNSEKFSFIKSAAELNQLTAKEYSDLVVYFRQ